MSAGIFKVIASFETFNGRPLTGAKYSVSLRDKDRFFDDKLGETALDGEGVAEFLVSAVDILSFDSVGETTPDLYFVVKQSGKEIFRSEVFDDVDFETKDPVTGQPDGLTKSFGPFQVPHK